MSTFQIGGEITVNRLGFGAMQITGPGVWGPPRDRGEALAVLKRLPGLGINFIDTADSYGPDVSEQLIREALHPYDGLLIATKAGFTRSGPNMWHVNCRPEHLIAQAHKSRRQLGVDQIKQASQVFRVATVQNSYNLADRESDDVVDYCEANGIGFIPYYQLGGDGELTRPGGVLDKIAKAKGVKPGQVALAWLLKRSPAMLPIPGTSKVAHLEENAAAASVTLTDEEFAALDRKRR